VVDNEGDLAGAMHAPLRKIQRLCVFCGSSTGSDPVYTEAARQLGSTLASAGVTLVFGGGRVGLMGILADSVLAARGQAVGVIPQSLVEREIAHSSLTHLHVVASMHERKSLMADLADAFLLLPGAYGSWEEFCEVVTWLQLGIHRKPCAILNVEGYYDSLLALCNRAVVEEFLRPAHLQMIIVERDPARVLPRLAAAPLPAEAKWAQPHQR
jgi:uncharacterized protein (TIGR00730 family)